MNVPSLTGPSKLKELGRALTHRQCTLQNVCTSAGALTTTLMVVVLATIQKITASPIRTFLA